MKSAITPQRRPRKASQDNLLQQDVTAMLRDGLPTGGYPELAHDIITVVRERVLREIESYARENIR